MAVSRRRFLEVGSMFAASIAVATNGMAQVANGVGSRPSLGGGGANLLTMTQATFKPLIGSVFLISTQTSTVISVVLTSVKESPATATPPVTDAFTLSFSSLPIGSPLPQGTYVFRHAALGSFSLFIVPSRPGAPRSYSAVFNHLQ
jgi:hypothetical protein